MSESIVVLDTNIIKGMNIKSLSEYITRIENNLGTLYLHEIVLDELVKSQVNKFETEIIKRISENDDYINVLNWNHNLDELIEKSKLRFEKSYLSLFKDRLLKRESIDFEELYKMSINKIPPFQNESGKSDQGFKDALIWLCLCKIKDRDVVFITKDSGFTKNTKHFSGEYLKKNGKKFTILSELPEKDTVVHNEENIVRVKKPDQKDEKANIVEEFKRIEKFRKNLEQILEEIVFSNDPNPYSSFNLTTRFNLYSKIENFSLDILLTELHQFIIENIMSSTCASEVFILRLFGVAEVVSKYDIHTETLVNLYDLLKRFIAEFPEYSNYIFQTIRTYINRYTLIDIESEIEIDENDLPF